MVPIELWIFMDLELVSVIIVTTVIITTVTIVSIGNHIGFHSCGFWIVDFCLFICLYFLGGGVYVV